MFEQQTENRRVEMRGNCPVDMRQQLVNKVGARRYLIWKLRIADRWTVKEIATALELHRRTVERCVNRVRTALSEIREEA